LAEELIEVVQGRFGHLHAQGLMGVVAEVCGRLNDVLPQCQLPGALGDNFGVEAVEALAMLERLLHARQRMNGQ
jgi:hypothetical protein